MSDLNHIDKICKDLNIKNYTITSWNAIDVNGDINLHGDALSELPLQFNVIYGNFYCSGNKLTTLKGCPKSVGDGFDCGGNNLTSLEGSPESVGGHFNCQFNNLIDLKGSPKSIGGGFYCHTNPIGSIFDKVDIDFIRTFKTFKIIKDGVIDLKRLKYLMSMFDLPIDLKDIKKYYTIK